MYVSKSNHEPYCIRGNIHIPHPEAYDWDYALIGRSFLHEAYHAYAYVVGIDAESIEQDAEKFARSIKSKDIKALAKQCDLPNVDWWND